MAKDVITRFKLETTQYDSALRDASKSLSAYAKKTEAAGKNFTNFSQKAVEAARSLGAIASGATNTKDKLRDLVGAYNDVAKTYNKLTEQQRQTDFGKAMAASLEQLQARIKQTKQELYGLNDTAKKVGDNGALKQLLGGVAGKFGMSASMFTGVGAAVAGIGAAYKAISDNISTAMGFEKSMSQLSSLTGMVGKDLEQLKEYAIELGSTSTLTASQVADAFRLIGSQQPQLLASGEALKEVTKYAITLSEAAGIDLVTAAQTLSTSINQMGGDSNNAARYVNVLAAASQKGAGDIAWLGEAITKSATAAKAVGTDYEELVANLEQLAKAGFDASTAGTALRSIIMNLEKQANNDFKPSMVGLTQAFENLGKANLTIVDYQQIAGKMFASQAMALANAAQEAKNMTVAITGTNTATEQATTNTTNLDGSLKALASAWEGLNLHINSSNGLLKDSVDWLKDVVTWVDKAISGMGKFAKRRAELNNEGAGEGNTRIDRQINTLSNTADSRKASVYSQQIEKYWRYINEKEAELQKTQNTKDIFAWETIAKNNKVSQLTQDIGAAKEMLKEYEQRGKAIVKSVTSSTSTNGNNGKVTIDVETDTEESTKSIKQLQDEIKKLKVLRDDAANSGDTKLRDQYNAQIKDVQAQIKAMRGTGSTTNHKVTVVPIEGSIDAQTKKVQDLQKAWRTAADDDSRRKIKEQIEQAQLVLDVMNGKTKLTDITIKADTSEVLEKLKGIEGITIDPKDVTIKADTSEALAKIQDIKNIDISISSHSLSGLENELKELNEQRKLLSDPIEIELIDNQIKEVKDKIDQLNGKKVEIEIVPSTLTSFEQLKQSISIELAEDNIKVDETTLQSLMQTAIQNGIDGLDPQFASLQDKMREGMNIPDSAWEDLQTQINENLKELGIEPIKIDFKTGNLAKDGKETEKSWQAAAQAVQSVGGAMQSIEDPAAKVAGTIAQAIASIALGYAQATTQAATLGPWAWVAFAATGMAQMISMISAIHSSTGYANGGIVKGNSYSGDNIPAMVGGSSGELVGLNAGEVVLNKAAQSNLANQLQGNNIGNMRLVARVKGTDLLFSLENTLQMQGYGKIATWG